MALTPEQEALLVELAEKTRGDNLLAKFDANTGDIEDKRIVKHNEILQAIQQGKYDLIPDINNLDLEAKPTDAFPDIVVAKDVSEDQ